MHRQPAGQNHQFLPRIPIAEMLQRQRQPEWQDRQLANRIMEKPRPERMTAFMQRQNEENVAERHNGVRKKSQGCHQDGKTADFDFNRHRPSPAPV